MVDMKYIIMCGGNYFKWETPRQLTKIFGEELVARTIRLLKENGIKDINISSNNPIFKQFGVPILEHNNYYDAGGIGNTTGDWYNAFYPTDVPTCYLFGDVFYSPQAIKTIVETKTDDIELFGSKQPFAPEYFKTHIEPFALKVVNTKHLWDAIDKTREYDRLNKFWRKPIVWELFTIIKDAPLQKTMDEYTTDYVVINDYTCDIDNQKDIEILKRKVGDIQMVKVEVINRDFTLARFDELENIERKAIDTYGKLYVGDKFVCTQDLCDYLLGDNKLKEAFVKVIEVIPNETIAVVENDVKDTNPIEETKPKKKKSKKK